MLADIYRCLSTRFCLLLRSLTYIPTCGKVLHRAQSHFVAALVFAGLTCPLTRSFNGDADAPVSPMKERAKVCD